MSESGGGDDDDVEGVGVEESGGELEREGRDIGRDLGARVYDCELDEV